MMVRGRMLGRADVALDDSPGWPISGSQIGEPVTRRAHDIPPGRPGV